VNPDAHEAYLLGRFFWTKRDAQSLKTSVGYYEQALGKDPNYAAAYAGLAESYDILAFGLAASEAVMPPREAAVKARAAAMKALEMDDSLAEAHVALGYIDIAGGHDKTGAERELRRAIELNPGGADAQHWLAQLLEGAGRQEEALRLIQRAHELDPLSPNILRTQGMMLTGVQRYGEAMAAFQKAVALAPNQINVRFSLAQHYEMRGMYPEALEEYQKLTELMKNDSKSRLMVAYANAMTGRRQEAEDTLQRLRDRATPDKTAYWFALVTNALGRRDEALGWLERARLEDALQGLPLDNFRFGALRSDPRYQNWLKRVELPYALSR
jgi:tetratricopeptide (TPR) repeat protein